MIGEAFVGQPGIKLPQIVFPVLSDIPFLGPLLFKQDLIFYLSIAARRRRQLVPVQEPRRTEAALRRRQPRLGPCARHQCHPHALSCRDVRRRLRRPRGRAAVAGLYAAMGGEHVGRARLDRAGAGRLCLLAALAGGGRRLSVWCGFDQPAARPGASASGFPRSSFLLFPIWRRLSS